MKTLINLAFLLLIFSCRSFAQAPAARARRQEPLPPPLTSRQVSGVVKDAKGEIIVGAVVTLKSTTDSLVAATNEDGIFIFKEVKQATFLLEVKALGNLPYIKRYLNNDVAQRIVLDPVLMKNQENLLDEVKIDGSPSIVYKVDTVEYRAADYKVRPNATLDELLKKMEGMEVGTDGSLTHQGQNITRAKLNGKEYSGGNVAQAIQNLPADIIEKVQIVDDYGDQAARTGVKDGDPQKILNVTTRADRSVGTTGRLTTQYGSNDRYNGQLFLQRLNGNRQLGVIANFRNTVNGVASTGDTGGGGGGGSGGTTKTASPTLNYRDQWNKKTQVVGSYAYTYSNNNVINKSFGQRFSAIAVSPGTFINDQSSGSLSNGHRAAFEIDYDLDSANYMQINPTFNTTSSNSVSNSLSDNVNNYTTTGFEHKLVKSVTSSINNNSSFGLTALYLHTFKKPKRNVSVQLSVNRSQTDGSTDANTHTKNYADTTQNTLLADSLSHVLTDRKSDNTTYRATLTYVEPLSKNALLQFAGETRYAVYDNTALTDTVKADGTVVRNPSMDNIYNYSIHETRLSLNYRYNAEKYNLSLGAAVVPFALNGSKINNSTGLFEPTTRTYTRIIPVLRYNYNFSRTEKLQITYTGRNSEPNFSQIQPFIDRSNPNNVIIGNPDLKPTFTHSINTSYNNYLANAKLNFSITLNGSLIDNQVSTNTFIKPVPIGNGKNRSISEVHYVNISGAKQYSSRYNFSKSFDNRAYVLAVNGSIDYNFGYGMSEGIRYNTTTWNISQRFGPQINPAEWIEFNPYYEYRLQRTFSTAAKATATSLQTNSFVVTSKMYFFKTFQVNYRVSKSFVTGLANNNTKPLIINAGFEKEFFARRNLVLTFNIFDLLHQNNFVQQTVSSQGVTNTLSNALSRYFLFGLRLNLQKWSGRPQRGGRVLERRGDGSFIY
ncbi:outer membrane beta-barrel protein [Mucilaginibacter calamicampi]|uniref:Outer membrane beta-barrel protein n=1 Tax=Mucilaginibacter calamicampi TaxID=1302352 RepID=A0ABW2YWZ9_9SPHI